MSLAGTRKVGSAGEWGDKEQEEQRIVTEYITCNLSSSMASLQRFIIWKQSSVRVAFGKAVCTMTAIVSERSAVTSLTLNRSFGYLEQDCQYILGLGATYCGYQRALLAMAVLVRQNVNRSSWSGGPSMLRRSPMLSGSSSVLLRVPAVPTPGTRSASPCNTRSRLSPQREIVLTKATCCHRVVSKFFFQELGKRYGVPGPFCDKRIDVQYHAPAIRGAFTAVCGCSPPPVTHREIRHCGRFRKAIGTQVLLVFRAAVSLIKVDVQHAGICYVLLALPDVRDPSPSTPVRRSPTSP